MLPRCCRLVIMSFCHYLIIQFFLKADWDFVAKWASNATSKMKVWGQLLWAPPKAVPCSSPQCSPHNGSSAKLEAVKSPKGQTPVGMEQLGLFDLGRRKADYLCWSLMGVRSPPTRKPAMGFLEMRDVIKCGFPCLIRKSELSMFTFCLAFLGCYIREKWSRGCKEPCLAGLGCAGQICSSLCPGLTSSSCCQMRHHGVRVWISCP